MKYTINKGCIGCGSCYAVCPAKAIDFGDDIFVINKETCLGCGTCAKICPICVITEDEND